MTEQSVAHKICAVEGCDNKKHAHIYCGKHYYKYKTYGDPLGGSRRDGCEVEGCDRKHFGKGYCSMHYARWRKSGDASVTKTAYRQDPECSVPGCDSKTKARGYCSAHWARWKKNGDPGGPIRAPKIGCDVDGCEKLHHSGGYCSEHYGRLKRHGDPTIRIREEKGVALEWLMDHLDYKGDDCLLWPFGRHESGYGYVYVDGRNIIASRYICRLLNGDPESEDLHAAHSCGKGHLGCVNPKHLRWATVAENTADKYKHGTIPMGSNHPLSKLTEEAVLEIRSMKGKVKQQVLADKFGVSCTQISVVMSRKEWTHV